MYVCMYVRTYVCVYKTIIYVHIWASEARLNNESQLRFLYIYIYIYNIYKAKFKEVNVCPPRKLLKNVNISVGARSLGEKKRLRNNDSKTKKYGKEPRKRRGETFAVRSCKLNRVHFLFF